LSLIFFNVFVNRECYNPMNYIDIEKCIKIYNYFTSFKYTGLVI
jgi:hypothetical protein